MKSYVTVFLGLMSLSARADTTYYTISIHNVRVGYCTETRTQDTLNGKPVVRTDSHTEMTIVDMGQKARIVRAASSWVGADNRLLREVAATTMAGRPTVSYDCVLGDKSAEVDVIAYGKKSHTTLPLPSGPVYGDEAPLVAQTYPHPGDHFEDWSLDIEPSAAAKFILLRVQTVGVSDVTVDGKPVKATLVNVQHEGGGTEKLYVNSAGELLRVEDSMLQMVSVSKAVALAPLPKNLDDTDEAFLTSISSERMADKRLDHVDELAELRVMFFGPDVDLSKAPSDEIETVFKGDKMDFYSFKPDNPWCVDVHPPQIADSVPESVEDAAKGYEKWTEPDTFMPSDNPTLKALAAKITAKEKTVVGAILAIKNYVGHLMRPKVVFGQYRDAMDILHDRTGVCGDYMILTTTLLRAVGIPARLAVGLVTWDPYGTFYTHGWTEAWDGRRWIGVDATDPHPQFSACHIPLCKGDFAATTAFEWPWQDFTQVRAFIYYTQPCKRKH